MTVALDHIFSDRALNVAADPQCAPFGSPCPCCGVEMFGSCEACRDDRCANCNGRGRLR